MVLQPVEHRAQLPDFGIAQAAVVDEVLEERNCFAAEQPMNEVVNDLANGPVPVAREPRKLSLVPRVASADSLSPPGAASTSARS